MAPTPVAPASEVADPGALRLRHEDRCPPGSVSFTVTPSASATKALKSALKRKQVLSVTEKLTYQSARGGGRVSHAQTIPDRLTKGKRK